MNKKYYTVYILDKGNPTDFPLLCEVVTEISTKHFGRAPIFREVLTDKIIRPLYDSISEVLVNEKMGTLIYDNNNLKSYYKISTKKTLKILRNISNNTETYLEIINSIEDKRIKRALVM